MGRTGNGALPLRIGLVMQGGAEWIGGTQYVKNLIYALDALPAAERAELRVCLVCPGNADTGDLVDVRQGLDELHVASPSDLPLTARVARRATHRLLHYDTFIRGLIADAHVAFAYPYFPGTSRERAFAAATWIADFQHLYLPEFFSPAEIEHRATHFRRVARWAPCIVVSSEVARSDLLRLHPECHERVHVLRFRTHSRAEWFDADPVAVQHRYGLPDRFFLVSNQFWRHKNHRLVVDALRTLATGGVRPTVVCTGRVNDYRAPSYGRELLEAIASSGLADQVHVLGLIPRNDQVQLMRRALAVLQPSRFEGWSTVVEDARALGKHLLLSGIDVHREQAPPSADYFDVDGASALAELLRRHWEHAAPGPAPSEAGARARNALDVAEFARGFLAIARVATSSKP